ncbi:MAG: pilus assembly protein PilM [Patescibacteria group bacterium]
MASVLSERLRIAFAPPRYLALPYAGIDLSASGVKAVRLHRRPEGLVLAGYTAETRFAPGAFVDGEIIDRAAVVEALGTAAHMTGITATNAALPESKSYLFETVVPGARRSEWRVAVEQQLDELVPLPPTEAAFDIIGVRTVEQGGMQIAGVGFARRIVDNTIAAFDEAGVEVRALEGEPFAMARALLPTGDTSTTLIIDIGKTTTKLTIVVNRIPRYAATIGIGGHALTLAVQKHFGVTETEARKVKADRGIVPSPGNEDYLAAMLSTVSAIRDEIARRLQFWQDHATTEGKHEPVIQAIIAGGNGSVRGLPEYLEGSLHVPVMTGDVFTNLASRNDWIPELDYRESLAYATAIGLALRDATNTYE